MWRCEVMWVLVSLAFIPLFLQTSGQILKTNIIRGKIKDPRIVFHVKWIWLCSGIRISKIFEQNSGFSLWVQIFSFMVINKSLNQIKHSRVILWLFCVYLNQYLCVFPCFWVMITVKSNSLTEWCDVMWAFIFLTINTEKCQSITNFTFEVDQLVFFWALNT